MVELPMLADARRQLDICNACRYCEGLCAVFPAIERRRFFKDGDITYIASLCHDCRACYDTCPYAPPHELAVDIPRLLSGVRERTHAHYAWPRWLASRMDRHLLWAGAYMLACAGMVVVGTAAIGGVNSLFAVRTGPGSFYEIVPWLAMLIPFMGLSVVVVAIMGWAGWRFWRDTETRVATTTRRGGGLRASFHALIDIAGLRYLRGGGPGCTYPTERPNTQRRIMHSLVFYGFVAAFISTVSAAIMQDFFGLLPPYDFLSIPVVLGSIGGVAMIVGSVGLVVLKRDADPERISPSMRTMDVAFIVALAAVNVTGFGVLLLRETAALGVALTAHLGVTAALYMTLPYGKFAHAMYRSLALLRYRREAGRGDV